MNTGYIKLWRKFCDTSFFRKPNCVSLAIYLLIKCNHEPKVINFNGKDITIARGQCITGRYALAHTLGMSEQSLRTAMWVLACSGFLTTKSTNRFTIVSIGKYGQYQGKSTNKLTNHQPTTNHPSTTSKELKNERREEEKNTEPIPGKAGGASSEPLKGEGEPSKGRETAEAYIVRQFKEALGIPADDYDWDMGRGPKCLEYAQKIVNAFPGDKRYATEWARQEIARTKEWADKNGKDFSLALIAHKALDAKGKWLEEKANQEKYARR